MKWACPGPEFRTIPKQPHAEFIYFYIFIAIIIKHRLGHQEVWAQEELGGDGYWRTLVLHRRVRMGLQTPQPHTEFIYFYSRGPPNALFLLFFCFHQRKFLPKPCRALPLRLRPPITMTCMA